MRREAITMQSPEDEKSLRELDSWLRSRAHSQAAVDAKIAEHSDKALHKILQSHDYIDRLASILENHGFGSSSRYWSSEADLAKDFWTKVSKARIEKERRMNIEQQIRTALPKGMFDHYEWYRFADHSLSSLKHVRTKCSGWKSWRYLLNWAMLHRDKGYRDNWQKFGNTAVLIGQHHHNSAIKTARSPVEKKDLICAKLWLDKCPGFEQNERNHWEWDRETTTKYMGVYSLAFDDNGFIVSRTGSFNESLMDQILFCGSHAAHETTRLSHEKYGAPVQLICGPHAKVLPPLSASRAAASHRPACGQMPFVQSSLSSTLPSTTTAAYSQSPACDSSPGVEQNETERLDVGISEASSTPQDYIEALARQAPFNHRPLKPPSSAGGLVQGTWTRYVKMIDDIVSSITRDEDLQHTESMENVLGHLRSARGVCVLHSERERCIRQL